MPVTTQLHPSAPSCARRAVAAVEVVAAAAETGGAIKQGTPRLHPVTRPTVVVETAVVDRVVVAVTMLAVSNTNTYITAACAGITHHTRRTNAPDRAHATSTVPHVQTLRAALLTDTAPDAEKACGAQLDVT